MGVNCTVRKIVNTNPTASTLILFSGLTRGVVFLTLNTTLNNGRFDCMIFIVDANHMTVALKKEGSDSYYQNITLNNGTLSITNTGYGIGEFTAIHIG